MAPGGATGWFLPLINYHWTPGRQRQARSLRAGCQLRGRKISHGLGRFTGLAIYRLPLRLEHVAHRPVAVGEGTLYLQGVPAAASAGDLQPEWHPAANGEK